MKNADSDLSFEIKKKTYHPPQLMKYGTFAEYTKGQGVNGNSADGQVYYGLQLTS